MSTFLLLVCFLRLKDVITRWIATYGKDDDGFQSLQLIEQDWTHILYLVVLLQPYYMWTDALSKSNRVTINLCWLAFNDIF
jgi:hypothetical protein